MLRLLKTMFAANKTPRTRQTRRSSFRPMLEAFEDRLVPSTLTVTSLADNGAAGTLRYEVNQANADAARGVSDTIVFAGGLRGGTITLSRGVLELTRAPSSVEVTINGGNAITLSGGNVSQVFEVDKGATVALANLNIKSGKAFDGGALYNGGTLYLTNCDLYANNGNYGGAVENSGWLEATSTTFGSNNASVQGGAIWSSGTLNLYSCEFAYNTSVYGGAIFNTGTLETAQACSFVENNASISGGALYNQGWAYLNQGTFNGNSAQYGGGLYDQGTVYFDNSTFLYNHASRYGGGFYFYSGYYSFAGINWEGSSSNTAGIAGNNYYIA